MASNNGRDVELRHDLATMVFKIAIIIFAVEVHIMLFLNQISIPPPLEDWVDATALTLIASPIIYYGVARPFLMAARNAEKKLEAQLVEMQRLLESNERLRHSLQEASATTADTLERILQKIGSELHDGPAQLLTFSMLHLERLKPVVAQARDQKSAFDLDKHRQVLGDVLREVRTISAGLTLPELAELSLRDSIELAVRRNEELYGIHVAMAFDNLPADLPLTHKATIYRVVQEALGNGYRHGKANSQWLEARCSDDVLKISVRDNGCGIAAGRPGTGLGIPGMRARVRALGGDFTVESAPGAGTSVTAVFPLDRIAAEPARDGLKHAAAHA